MWKESDISITAQRMNFMYEKSAKQLFRDKESAMNTVIGHLENIMEQRQQPSENTNKTHHRRELLYPWRGVRSRNGVALNSCLCVDERL